MSIRRRLPSVGGVVEKSRVLNTPESLMDAESEGAASGRRKARDGEAIESFERVVVRFDVDDGVRVVRSWRTLANVLL